MTIEKIPDHYIDLFPLIISQFEDKENYNKLLKIVTKQIDEIEDMLFDLLDLRWLDLATKAQLDLLGRILDIERGGLDDESYRSLLNLKISINVSSGEPESIIVAIIGVFDTVNTVQYIPAYPGKFQIWTDGNIGIFNLDDFILDAADDFLLDLGDNFIVNLPDPFAENLLTEISPAGVDFILLGNLVVDEDFLLGLSTGGHLLVN